MSHLYHSLKHVAIKEVDSYEMQHYILNFEKSCIIQEKMFQIVECFAEENNLSIEDFGQKFQCPDDYDNVELDLSKIPSSLLALLYKFLTLHASSMAVDLQRYIACEI